MPLSDSPASRPPLPTFDDISSGQSHGWECIVCRANLLAVGGESVPESVVVGLARSTGDQVRACAGRCAPMVGYRPSAGCEQMDLIG